MSVALERLKTEVAEMKTVAQSVLTLLANVAAEIREHRAEPEELNKLADDLDAMQVQLTQAVLDNTPAAPATGSGDDPAVLGPVTVTPPAPPADEPTPEA